MLRLSLDTPAGWSLGALGADRVPLCVFDVPGAARPTLPALRDRDGLAAVPRLGFFRDGGLRRRASAVSAGPAAHPGRLRRGVKDTIMLQSTPAMTRRDFTVV